MLDWLIEAGLWVWDSVLGLVQEAGTGAWNGFVDDIPAFDDTGLEVVTPYLVLGNQWLPFDVALAALGTYYGFLAVFVAVKMVLKLIPTVG